jgi:hypothetical protein
MWNRNLVTRSLETDHCGAQFQIHADILSRSKYEGCMTGGARESARLASA